jgi:hypothetical protein
MTDQQLLISAVRKAGHILAEHLKPSARRDAEETIAQLVEVLDNEALMRALERLEKGHGLLIASRSSGRT